MIGFFEALALIIAAICAVMFGAAFAAARFADWLLDKLKE